jgi:hypothetical protein
LFCSVSSEAKSSSGRQNGPASRATNGEPRFGQLAGEGAAAGAGTDDDEIHLVDIAVLAHRDPSALAEDVRRPAAFGARHAERVIRHAR